MVFGNHFSLITPLACATNFGKIGFAEIFTRGNLFTRAAGRVEDQSDYRLDGTIGFFLSSWVLGALVLRVLGSWVVGFLSSWVHGFMGSWVLGFLG